MLGQSTAKHRVCTSLQYLMQKALPAEETRLVRSRLLGMKPAEQLLRQQQNREPVGEWLAQRTMQGQQRCLPERWPVSGDLREWDRP